MQISLHGYGELGEDEICLPDILEGAQHASVVEECPEYPPRPWVLALQRDREGKPIHVVWGVPRGLSWPAVLITAYRPDPAHWDDGYKTRKRRQRGVKRNSMTAAVLSQSAGAGRWPPVSGSASRTARGSGNGCCWQSHAVW